ncbi:MAG: T9SS type A sorting domain-containing protein [Ferruginibacter sp.]
MLKAQANSSDEASLRARIQNTSSDTTKATLRGELAWKTNFQILMKHGIGKYRNYYGISFTAQVQNSKADIFWKITGAENNTNYILQSSRNGTQFYDMNTQTGDNIKTDFYYNDIDFNSIAYYRLKIISVDGKVAYSNIIKLSNKKILLTTIYPNQVKNMATIEINDNILMGTQAKLLSVSGAVLQKININNHFEIINMTALPAGIYLLQTNNGAVQKIIKN